MSPLKTSSHSRSSAAPLSFGGRSAPPAPTSIRSLGRLLAPHLPVQGRVLRWRRVRVLVVGESLSQLGQLLGQLLDLFAELSDLASLADIMCSEEARDRPETGHGRLLDC